MAHVPDNRKIYHITHLRNLRQIVEAGMLWSNAKRIELRLDSEIVGMLSIKRRRLDELRVKCHPETMVGEYVPFYFCPRSIMLFILYKANHPDLSYRGGQGPIVHLVADLHATVAWAQANQRRWAFSDCNAATRYAHFFRSLDDLDNVNWAAVAATDFREMVIMEGKQAEFLVYESFPWELVEKIGVLDAAVMQRVHEILADADHKPVANVEPTWYY